MALNPMSRDRLARSLVIAACGNAALKALLVTVRLCCAAWQPLEKFPAYRMPEEIQAEGETVENDRALMKNM